MPEFALKYFQSRFNRQSVRMSSNMTRRVLLAFINLFLLANALPSMQNRETVNEANRLVKDESDNSSGSDDAHVLPVSRYRKINERRFSGRESDAPSKCGYEVRRTHIFIPLINLIEMLHNYSI